MQPEQIIEYIDVYKLNTKKNPNGYCHGLASMARDAFLLGPEEYKRYRNRLHYMGQDAFLNQMKAFIRQAQLLTTGDIVISAIAVVKLNQWPLLIQYAAVSLGKSDDKINANDLYFIYLETRAFLETMTILFAPDFHKELFAKKEVITQNDHEVVLPLMRSCLAEQQGGTIEVNNFISSYSDEEMVDYLRSISNIQTEKRFAIMLACTNHVVALFYEQNTKQWILDDHGVISIYFDTEAGLAGLSQELGDSLSNDKEKYALSTRIYSLGYDQKAVTQAFSSLCKKENLINHAASSEEIADLLYLASQDGHVEVVKVLLKHPQCSLNEQDEDGYTALHLASQDGHVEVVKVLLEHPQCSLNEQNEEGYVALHFAAQSGNIKVVKALLDHPQCNLNEKDDDGYTALHFAAQNGHISVVNALLDHPQCSPNEQEDGGYTALHAAAQNGHVAVVNALLVHPQCDPGKQDEEGYTALHLAAKNSQVEVVKSLLCHLQYDQSQKTDKYGFTAFQIANQCGYVDVKALLEHFQNLHNKQLSFLFFSDYKSKTLNKLTEQTEPLSKKARLV